MHTLLLMKHIHQLLQSAITIFWPSSANINSMRFSIMQLTYDLPCKAAKPKPFYWKIRGFNHELSSEWNMVEKYFSLVVQHQVLWRAMFFEMILVKQFLSGWWTTLPILDISQTFLKWRSLHEVVTIFVRLFWYCWWCWWRGQSS